MDPPEHESAVPTLPQSEIISPGEDTSRTIQADPFTPSYSNVPRTTTRINSSDLGPFFGDLSSPIFETSPVNETTSPHHPTNNDDDPAQLIRSPLPVRLLSLGRRETKTNDSIKPSNEIRQIDDNGIAWIVPKDEQQAERRTVGERLEPTLATARIKRDKYTAKAKWTGWTLNIAIGLQVLFGSLTTGLSAVAVSGGKSTAVGTTILGALATLVASYLARARGSNEPDLSITRSKDLDQFIRECELFQMDHGHKIGHDFDNDIIGFRLKFEELLGNANGERKLSSV